MIDDYDNRRRDSIDNLNRRDDQSHIQEMQRKKTKAVYDAILNNDDMRIRQELDITPSEVGDYSLGDAGEECRPITVEEQFREHASNLRVALLLSQFLPGSFTEEWVDRLTGLDINTPLPVLGVVKNFALAYAQEIEKHKPQRDIFNLAISEEMGFDHEKDKIMRELDLLRNILNEVIAGSISNALKELLAPRQLTLRKNRRKEGGETS